MNRKTAHAPLVMPILSPGSHRTPVRGACFMEFASYIAGERWSDHPACTHPLLAQLARGVNDQLSDDARTSITSLIPRVVGLTSDDPRVSTEIALRAAIAALPVANVARQRALAVGLIGVLARVMPPELHAMGRRALDSAPDAERWARVYSARLGSARIDPSAANASIVNIAVEGISVACIEDSDARLTNLLIEAIETVERSRDTVMPARRAELISA